ncbi:hypothetical protein [Nitrosarchaeum sp. AC2]|nr:hypothetical protein [Nitrosarchaeum sp. AC2]
MTKIIIGISIDEKVLSGLDKKRGLIPRSKYLEYILIKSMRMKNGI